MPIDLANIPRAITAIAEWFFVVLIIVFSKKRVKGWKLYGIIGVALPVQIIYMVLTGPLPVMWWIPAMFGAVFLMFLFIYSTCDVSMIGATYLVAKAFVLAEFAASLQYQLYYFIINTMHTSSHVVSEYGFAIFMYLVIFLVGYMIEYRYRRNDFIMTIRRGDMISIVSIVVIIFTISNLSFLDIDTPISSSYPEEIFYIRTLVDLCGIILIYMHREHHYAMHTQHELTALQSAFQNHYNYYRSSKDNLDMINTRLHDLKHQLNLIKAESDENIRAKYLNDIERNIHNYGVRTDTGYHVLDVIITSKSMRCIDEGINFTYVIDGQLLEFMSVVDISSLFGNAIDNAIESVKKIDDEEKRLIKLAVYRQKSLLMIKFENYYENDLYYQNGILASTKIEKENHGYGIKSINNIADKYGGSVTIDTSNNWFVLCVLLPLQ